MPIRFHLVSQPVDEFYSDTIQKLNFADLLPSTFGINLSPIPRGNDSTNSQISP